MMVPASPVWIFWSMLCLSLGVAAYELYPEPGPDIFGPFCAVRVRPGQEPCCPGRDDQCTVPILDTVCYCDEFCRRSMSDCCPDYSDTCRFQPPTTEIKNNCIHFGKVHAPEDRIKVNCNNCTCVMANNGGVMEYNWKCTQKTCVIREELMDHVNYGQYSWHADNYTFLWGLTLDDGVRYRLGTFKPHSLVESMTSLRIQAHKTANLPEEFDGRREWSNTIHPIMDQGNCGASWAFSTASVAADRLTLHSHGVYPDMLSPQQILDCDTDYKQKGCEGGHLDRAWWYMRTIGVVTEPCYPYISGVTGRKGHCKVTRQAMRRGAISCPNPTTAKSAGYQVAPPYRISPRENEIMAEIKENGPVQALMEVREDFFQYKSGVYKYSMPATFQPPNRHKTGFHSVKILGWGVDHSTGRPIKYWLCANSWGTQWGEDGYFRIVRGINESQIESFVLGFWAKVNGRELRYRNRESVAHRIQQVRRRHRHRRHLRKRRRRH